MTLHVPRRFIAAVVLVAGVPAITVAKPRSFSNWTYGACEPPSVYYSSAHVPNAIPCCQVATDNACPDRSTSCSNGQCAPTTKRPTYCVPGPVTAPNLVLYISDDQGATLFSFLGASRSGDTGTARPAPATAAIDALAQGGRVFPVAHNVAPVCWISMQTIFSGRLPAQVDGPPGSPDPNVPEQDFGHVDNPGIAKLLKERGYCANQEGKLYVAGGKGLGFDGMDVTTSVGRVRCSRCGITDPSDPRLPSCQEPPKCGEEEEPTPSYSQTGNIDLFLDTMVVQGPAGPRQPQPFFLWYAPHVPHIPVSPSRLVESRPHVIPASVAPDWLFGAGPDLLPRFPFAAPLYQPLFEENDMLGLYGNVWLADNGLARLRTMLVQRTVTSGNSCVSGWCSN